MLTHAIVSLFGDSSSDDAYMVLMTHGTTMLRELVRNEVVLVEKNYAEESLITPLVDWESATARSLKNAILPDFTVAFLSLRGRNAMVSKKNGRRYLLICCEGKAEREYFLIFRRLYRISAAQVSVIGEKGQHKILIDRTIEERDRLCEDMCINQDEVECWAVCDG